MKNLSYEPSGSSVEEQTRIPLVAEDVRTAVTLSLLHH